MGISSTSRLKRKIGPFKRRIWAKKKGGSCPLYKFVYLVRGDPSVFLLD